MLWTYFMSLPGVMYTGLYLISRSRIVAYLDDIVKFGDYRQIWRWYLPKLAVDLEYVISLAIAGSPANSQSKPLIFTASVHLALTKLVWSDSQTFWAWSIERTYETGDALCNKEMCFIVIFSPQNAGNSTVGCLISKWTFLEFDDIWKEALFKSVNEYSPL